MELQENDIQVLSDFWDGHLDEDETAVLEQRLLNEPEFASAAREFFLALNSIDKLRRQKIADQFKTPDPLHPPDTKVRPIWIKLVAAFFVIAVSALLAFNLMHVPSNLKLLADQSRNHYAAPLNLGDDTDDLLEIYEKADEKGDEKEQKYAYVAPLLAKVYDAKRDSIALLYSGIAYCLAKEDQKAIRQLRNLINTRYHKDAAWYLAVSYIGKGRKKKAVPLLQSIVDGKLPRAAKAQLLLKEIK